MRRSTSLSNGFASVLLVVACSAGAQSAAAQAGQDPKSAQDSTPQKTEHINSQDQKTGNDLSANRNPTAAAQDSDPAKTTHIGTQDHKTGNDLVANKKADAAHFDRLDTNKAGAVTAEQAKNDKWLSKNFMRCDADKDNKVTRAEYDACANMN